MINKYICPNCKKSVVCEWGKTIEKKFGEDSKTAYDMTITIDNCAEFEEVE